ncbi:uncharacterized protein [Prorops nasuta]|uniref:uncharacterized protein n=1 Tax=Prorops nasuta TaxID=863751 RepID=UPI0034CD6EA6
MCCSIHKYFASALIIVGANSQKANSEFAKIIHRSIRGLSFPEFSTMGLFLALSVPLEEPRQSISLSYFFEATYDLPPNSTYFEPWTEVVQRKISRKRSIDRTTVYNLLENKFESTGNSGRACLLRAICEASESPLKHNGLIGDILHVIFTPTTSRQEELPRDIVEAELVGRNGTCSKYQPPCPLGLFDLIGILA